MPLPSRPLSADRVAKLKADVSARLEKGERDEAFRAARPLLRAVHELEPARALSDLTRRGAFTAEDGLKAASALVGAHPRDATIISDLGRAFEDFRDMRYLNAAPPTDSVLLTIARTLEDLVASPPPDADPIALHSALSTAARVLGRGWDAVAERSKLRVLELRGTTWPDLYGLGLFYKTRGRFAEGRDANQRALDAGGKDDEAVQWNLGICATGAGDAETALKVWKSMDHRIDLGRFGLPEGPYHSVKVRLAERPLAERDPSRAPDDPGLEETVWVERLSPCHGVIRSALYQDLGVDYGDVVLFDGAPITYHEYEGDKVAVFPHLATLVRPGYRIWRFGGTQREAKQIADLSRHLPDDTVLYVHTEQFQVLCHSCWEAGRMESSQHREVERHVVTGKLCAQPGTNATQLLEQLDQLTESGGIQLLVPELAREVGHAARADVEARRLAMIEGN